MSRFVRGLRLMRYHLCYLHDLLRALILSFSYFHWTLVLFVAYAQYC